MTNDKAPPTSDSQPYEMQMRRRRPYAELRREGKGTGRAPFGFRWAGRRGNRHLVPDPEQRQIMQKVVELRDTEELSWGKISDRVEEHLAEQEGRRPRSLGFRAGWTPKSCSRAYRAMKQLLEQGEPLPTHKRCKTCRRSLPLAKFNTAGRECEMCRLTGPLRAFEERAVVTAADLIGKRRADDGPLQPSAAELQHRVTGLIRDLERLVKQGRDTELAETIASFTQALSKDLAVTKPAEAMGDAELDRALGQQVRQLLRPALTQIQAELAMPDSDEPAEERTESRPSDERER